MQIERKVTLTLTNFILKTVGPVFVGGKLIRSDTIVELSRMEAADLLHRKKAIHADEAEIAAAGDAVIASGTIDADPDPAEWRRKAKWER
jgi:hypothetical protein